MGETNEIEQSVRRSHCAHTDAGSPDHRCVGVCTITPEGVDLKCGLCGSGAIPNHRIEREVRERATAILRAAGIRWDSLSHKTQAAIAEEVARTFCPGCRRELPANRRSSYQTCACGEWSYYSDTWRRKDDA